MHQIIVVPLTKISSSAFLLSGSIFLRKSYIFSILLSNGVTYVAITHSKLLLIPPKDLHVIQKLFLFMIFCWFYYLGNLRTRFHFFCFIMLIIFQWNVFKGFQSNGSFLARCLPSDQQNTARAICWVCCRYEIQLLWNILCIIYSAAPIQKRLIWYAESEFAHCNMHILNDINMWNLPSRPKTITHLYA